jgi:hypothetical protein
MSGHARDLQGARYALWKNPEDLTDRQRTTLAWVAKVNHRLYRAYLLKEQLRQVFALKDEAGKALLDRRVIWARRCRIPAFVDLARRITKHRASIDATLEHHLSNGVVESTNTKIRVLTRWPSASSPRKPSSPRPCSTSAATARPYPAARPPNHPRKQQERRKVCNSGPLIGLLAPYNQAAGQRLSRTPCEQCLLPLQRLRILDVDLELWPRVSTWTSVI